MQAYVPPCQSHRRLGGHVAVWCLCLGQKYDLEKRERERQIEGDRERDIERGSIERDIEREREGEDSRYGGTQRDSQRDRTKTHRYRESEVEIDISTQRTNITKVIKR